MTIEEFLDENTYNLTPEEYNQALDDSEKMDSKSWVVKYAPLMQEKAVGWNQVDAVKQSKPLATRIADAFADSKFRPGKTFKDDVYQDDFSDVPREQFEEALSKMRDYYDQEVKQRRDDADKEKRKREVKNDWFWRGLLTSDYEKQRYVEDPQSALIGDQAPEWGTAPETRWGSAADLGLGVVGAAGDVVPGWGSVLIGPGARIARDVGHKVTDSPYQKEWGDIVKGGITDVMISGGTIALPNFRKQIRMYNDFMTLPENVVAMQAIEGEARSILDGAQMLQGAKGGLEFRKAVEAMPESQLKKDLTPLLNSAEIDWNQAQLIINRNVQAANSVANQGSRQAMRDTYSRVIDGRAPGDISRRALLKTAAQAEEREAMPLHPLITKALSRTEPTAKELKSASRKMLADKAISKLSNPAANLVVTVPGGRAKGTVQSIETPEEREQIEAIKQREDRFWRAGFKPNKNESLLYKAWAEWKEENGGEE